MDSNDLAPSLPEGLVDSLRQARSLLVITGAGMSADSGLPTYRGIGGLYEDVDTDDGVPIEVALSGDMLRAQPAVAWKHIARIEASCRGARPNEGHRVLVELEARFDRLWVLTQNVDGLHGEAGSSNVIEIHGNVHHLRCTRCPSRFTVADYAELAIPPSCEHCGALVRPEVVLFGEMLPNAAIVTLDRELSRGFDAVVSIGTTSGFPYIAGPVVRAARMGKITIEINPGTTEVSSIVRHRITLGARDALVAIREALG